MHLDAEASLAPVSPLGVISDGVAGAETNPLGNGTVLLLRLGKLLLRLESLVARHFDVVVAMYRVGCRWPDTPS
jgi:hypothetical protein